MGILNEIINNLEKGNSSEIRKNVKLALDEDISYKEILKDMLKTMEAVGAKFRSNVIFVPEVLIIGRAFNVALEEIQPYITEEDYSIGTIVIGTVQGDHHDVGKNLVKLFFKSSNMKVIDLGINVSPQKFIDAIIKYKPDVIAMSALLTTTMIEMEKIITKIEEAKLRDNLKIIIGGVPITESYAVNIGADYYAKDAYDATEVIKNHFYNK